MPGFSSAATSLPAAPYARSVGDEGEPKHGDRPVWSLTRDEQRILAITFVGGLASIVAGVMIVGLSLALLRYEGPPHGHTTSSFLLSQGIVTVIAAIGTGAYISTRRQPTTLHSVTWTGIGIALVVTDIVVTLTWVGLAAGVK